MPLSLPVRAGGLCDGETTHEHYPKIQQAWARSRRTPQILPCVAILIRSLPGTPRGLTPAPEGLSPSALHCLHIFAHQDIAFGCSSPGTSCEWEKDPRRITHTLSRTSLQAFGTQPGM